MGKEVKPLVVEFPNEAVARAVVRAAESQHNRLRETARSEVAKPSVRAIATMQANEVGRGIQAIHEAISAKYLSGKVKSTKPSRWELQDMEDAHAQGLHDEIPREFCPSCESR